MLHGTSTRDTFHPLEQVLCQTAQQLSHEMACSDGCETYSFLMRNVESWRDAHRLTQLRRTQAAVTRNRTFH
jgi:hypothetical protein